MREITYAEAIMEAFREEMRRDDKVFHICGNLGPLAALESEFGIERLRASPISEEAYVGAGIGAAGSGFRPIISPGMMTFAFTAMDQIVNQMAKIHYMFGGQAPFPLVFRASTGGGRSAAAQHSQSPHPMFMNLAGLKLVMPSNAYDAKGLMKSAIRDNNPVVFFEDQILAALPDRFPVPEEEYVIPIGEADVKREGSGRDGRRHLEDGPGGVESRRRVGGGRHLPGGLWTRARWCRLTLRPSAARCERPAVRS